MKKIILFLVAALSLSSYAQPGTVDPGFSSFISANGAVNSSLTQPDGKIIIVGAFTNVNGSTSNRIARLNADGSKDLSFAINLAAGATSGRAIKTQSDGKIIVAGEFTTVNGNPVPARVIRLNADGTLDTTFNTGGAGADGTILSLAIDSSDRILIGGSFTNYNGTSRNRIARLNADGTLDTSFVVGTGSSSNVNAIAIQPADSKIIIAGNLVSYNGTSRSRIARLETNGSLDLTFVPATSNAAIRAIAVQADGKIICGGDFTTYAADVNKKYLVRINTDGSHDATYNSYGFDGVVRTISLDVSGKLFVGGLFANYDAVAVNNIARLNPDATLDTTFTSTGSDSSIESIVPQADGKLLIGGSFTTFNGMSKIRLVRISGYYSVQLTGGYCGAILNTWSAALFSDWVSSTATYRFRITKVDPVTDLPIAASITVDRPTNSIALSNVAGTMYNSKYRIEIMIRLNGVWDAFYGPSCFVTTQNPLATIGTYCGKNLTSMGEFVYANYTPVVTVYRFRVTNLSTNAFQVYDAVPGQNRFSFNQLSASIRAYGTTYSVEVALRNTDGTFLSYGAPCNVTTPAFPTTQIVPAQCNALIENFTDNIKAVIVTGATNYRFQLSNVSLGYSAQVERPVNGFNLNLFPGLLRGTTYTVLVSVRIGGVWGPTGVSCDITTPGSPPAPPARIGADSSLSFSAIAYPNPFADNFMFDVTTSDESALQLKVYDMLGKQIEDKTIDAASINTVHLGTNYPTGVYNVILSQGENTKMMRVVKR